MDDLSRYISYDRRRALLNGEDVPTQTRGAALFADISGFTALTSMLLKTLGPKRGPEALTRHLNQIYDSLIRSVHRYGGSVVNFSGDGIICWFDEQQGDAVTTGRAVACALVMQAHMKKICLLQPLTNQKIDVKIKIAIAAGSVRRFQVGDPTIQYIDVLAGKTIDRMAAAEQLAQAGEIVVSAEVIAQLGKAVKVGAWRVVPDATTGITQHFATIEQLCPDISAPDIQKIDVPPPPAHISSSPHNTEAAIENRLRLWLLKPVYERFAPGGDRFVAETCTAVPLFLKFTGIDYEDDEAADQKLDAYIRLVQNVLAHHEGHLVQVTIGDKGSYLYAVFGVPATGDTNDANQALAAALALRSLSTKLDFIEAVKIGLSRGRLRVGAYGGTTRRTYGVLGKAANTAAWLMSQAHPNQIVTTAPFIEAIASDDYTIRPLGAVPCKGQRELLPIFAIDRNHKLFRFDHLSREISTQIVERSAERSILGEPLSAANQTDYHQAIIGSEDRATPGHVTDVASA